jgi:hypothetical protein
MEVEQKSQVSSVNDNMELACSDGNQQSSHLNNKLVNSLRTKAITLLKNNFLTLQSLFLASLL